MDDVVTVVDAKWPYVFLWIWIMCELFQAVYLVCYHSRIGWRLLSWQILNMHELVVAA